MSDKNFEEKLKQHWREEADSIPVPDSLHPAKIEEMIDKKMEVPKKRTHKKLYAGITAAAMASAADIMLVVFQGFTVNPATVFLVYALLITAVRAVLLPTAIKRYIYS